MTQDIYEVITQDLLEHRILRSILELPCYGGSNILKASEYTRPVRLGVWRIRLGRQDSKSKDK